MSGFAKLKIKIYHKIELKATCHKDIPLLTSGACLFAPSVNFFTQIGNDSSVKVLMVKRRSAGSSINNHLKLMFK
jgi:hypothetical protein